MRMTNTNPLDAATDAENLLPALDVIAAGDLSASRDAARYAARLRFALDRATELQGRIEKVGGVFEPARLEVALTILETHHRRAAGFMAAVAAPAKAKTAYVAPVAAVSVSILETEDIVGVAA